MREGTDPLIPESEVTPIAEALRSLAPAATAINRDRLLFDAGRAAAPRPGWVWPASALVFAGLSSVLAVQLMFWNQPTTIIVERERIVEVRVPQPVESPSPEIPNASPTPKIEFTRVDLSPSDEKLRLLRIHRDVLRWGPEMLPASKPLAQGMTASEAARDLDRWLGVPSGTFSAPPQRPNAFSNIFGEN